ncbi:hypothetical protein [Streptomyces sp. NPDC005336]|uniref:hypothetical protein n=1 Tax=Streptomyces sp. NPDC005336 TaxID=3157035 RepID=UPI0033B1864F
MDSGIAAVLGALAGSVATIGAAMATGWAQRETARLTARAEHQRQRREPRHGIYKDFVSHGAQLRDQLEIFKDFDLYPNSLADETVQRCNDTARALQDKWLEVGLVGPSDAATIGKEIEQAARSAILQVQRLKWFVDNDDDRRIATQSMIGASAEKLAQLLDAFIAFAQGALDDDGSRK